MTKEEFIKKAETEKANFELHKRLIDFHLCDRENKNYSNDLKEFAEKQVVDGNLLLSLMEYAEAYYEERSKLHQPTVISTVCEHNFVPSIREAKVHTCVKCNCQRVEIAN